MTEGPFPDASDARQARAAKEGIIPDAGRQGLAVNLRRQTLPDARD